MIALALGQVKHLLALVDDPKNVELYWFLLWKGGREVEGVPLETGYPPGGGS